MGIVQLIKILISKTNKSTPIYFISLNREIYIVFIGDVAFIAHQYPNKPMDVLLYGLWGRQSILDELTINQ